MSQFPKPARGKKVCPYSFHSSLKSYIGSLQKFLKNSAFTTTRCDQNLSRTTRNPIGKVDARRSPKYLIPTLVTQPMLQLRPNCTPLRSMDYYHQIFCRFRKCKRKVPPPSPLSNDFEKSWFFSKILVTFYFFSLTKIFRPYKDFWSKISCIGM